MFQGLDPTTGELRCAPLWRADPRSKLAAGPLLEALRARAAEQGAADLEDLARSKALKGDVRSIQSACRSGGTRRVKVETVERLCRKVLGLDPRSLYGEGFEQAWQHRGKRVNERVQSFDHCFSSPKSVSLLAVGGGDHIRRQVAEPAPRPSRWASTTWSGTGLGSAATTTAPTATTCAAGCWRCIRAFEASDDRDRALVADWWQAHQAGEQPVIYAHRRAQADQLNQVCQRYGPRRANSVPSGWRSGTGHLRSAMWWCSAPRPRPAWAW
jgi:TrwC relaxase